MKLSRIDAILAIAAAAHAANKAYCESLGDRSQPTWLQAPDNIKASAVQGVEFVLENPDVTPAESHANWLEFKKADGWVYGEVKNAERKVHPCMVPFEELPKSQQIKDTLFKAVVKALIPAYPALALSEDLPETNESEEKALWIATKELVKELGLELEDERDYSDSLEFAVSLREAIGTEGEVAAAVALVDSLDLEIAEDDEDLPGAIRVFADECSNS